jgi:hypothetical protein
VDEINSITGREIPTIRLTPEDRRRAWETTTALRFVGLALVPLPYVADVMLARRSRAGA